MNVNFLKYYQIDYIIKEEEGVIVAKIQNPYFYPKVLSDILNKNFYKIPWSNYFLDGQHIAKMRGVAKCSPEDTFDVEKGKKIAYLRLRKKFDRYIIALLEDISQFYLNYVSELEGILTKLYYLYNKDSIKIGSYLGEPNFL